MPLQFDLITPEKRIFSREVEMVVVPGKEGDFGVLIGHSPLISSIRPGVLSIYENDNIIESIFIAGGFAEVDGKKLTVLANSATKVADIDVAAVREKLRHAEEEYLGMDEAHIEKRNAENVMITYREMVAAREAA